MSSDMLFGVSEEYERMLRSTKKEGSGWRIVDGKFLGRAPAIWYTNLDITKRHEDMILYKHYTPEDYPKYDNYDAINVDSVSDIPCDYDGIMGVPDSFLDRYNPEQFEILGTCRLPEYIEELGIGRIGEDWIARYRAHGGTGHYTANMRDLVMTVNGKPRAMYSRIIIRRKQS